MAICRACGRENPDDARFCNACGAALAPEAAPREVRKVVTVLFADVTGSTALGERLDPESTRRVMARWHDSMRAVLERHGGSVEKFIGDAVMALFGIPRLHEDDALRAVRAAAEMRQALAALNDELERDYSVRIEARIGVNTGEVVAGEGETLATGDAVNVAARLEQAAEPGEVLVGEQTVQLVRGAVEVEAVELPSLKGKSQPVAAYRLLAVHEEMPRRLDAPIVGRDRELALLVRAYDHATSERTAYLFTVLGPAGIGKSRLAQELIDSVRADATVLRGRCLSYGDGITYWPLAEMLQEAAHHEMRARLLERLQGERDADLIAGRLATAIGAADAAGSNEETFWAVRKLFERLARERPLVAVFEDLHWAEPTLLDLVDHLAEWSRDAPILLLCLARPELLEARPAWGGGKLNATSLLLEPLSHDESELLIDRLLSAALPAATRAKITDAAEGNPLFVEQMLAMLAEDGGGELHVPPTIHALLAARLDRLAPAERDVIQRAAVEGKRFHLGAVVELSPPELRPQVRTQLASLVRKELIRPDDLQYEDDDGFRFRHQLIRDAAYETMPKELRANLHERFAAWLEQAEAERIAEVEEILGYHLEQAYRFRAELGPVGEAEQELSHAAAERLFAAGRRALARRDAHAAESLLTRAAALLADENPSRLRILVELAEAVIDRGDYRRAAELYGDVHQRAASSGDETLAERARLWGTFAGVHAGTSVDVEALHEAELALEVFQRLGDDGGLADAWAIVGRIRFWLGSAGDAEPAYEKAIEYARRAGNRRRETETLAWLIGVKAHGPTTAEDGIVFCDQILAGAERDPLVDIFAWEKRAMLLAMIGRFDEARESVARARQIADEFGLALRHAYTSDYAAYVELLVGDLDACERELRDGDRALEALGEAAFRGRLAWSLAEVLHRRGELEEAKAVLPGNDAYEQARRAKILASLGNLGEAEQLARAAISELATTDLLDDRATALMDAAEAMRLVGEPGEAALVAAEARRLYEQKGNLVLAGRARAFLDELAVTSP